MCIRCIFQVKPHYYPKQIANGTLKRGGVFAYSQAVDALRHTAKFTDSNPNSQRHNRNDTSGNAKSVYFMERGLTSGSWGIQHGISRNNHVVSVRTIREPASICLIEKQLIGINVMNATLSPVGASAYPSAGRVSNPAQSAQKSLTFLHSLFAVQLAVEGNA
jgi:hypothetical protein